MLALASPDGVALDLVHVGFHQVSSPGRMMEGIVTAVCLV